MLLYEGERLLDPPKHLQANRERKKELKGAYKEEEIRQLSMQAKGQGQRVIRLK